MINTSTMRKALSLNDRIYLLLLSTRHSNKSKIGIDTNLFVYNQKDKLIMQQLYKPKNLIILWLAEKPMI